VTQVKIGQETKNEQLTYIEWCKGCVFWQTQVADSECSNIALQIGGEERLSERFLLPMPNQ
jgi:hypothetical protein